MVDTKRKKGWQAGVSGNPKGRPAGVTTVAKLRAKIEPDIPALLKVLMSKAMAGDVNAARMLLDRVLPPLKATEQGQVIKLPESSLTEQGKAILKAIANGELATSQGASLIAAVGSLAKVIEIDELTTRIEALEQLEKKHDT